MRQEEAALARDKPDGLAGVALFMLRLKDAGRRPRAFMQTPTGGCPYQGGWGVGMVRKNALQIKGIQSVRRPSLREDFFTSFLKNLFA